MDKMRRTLLSAIALSPLAVRAKDFDLVRKVSWEGITCDYCHSIREVSKAAGNLSARVEVSDVKSGPSKDSVSPSHEVAYSEVHTRSEACAVCHEYVNSPGVSGIDHVFRVESERIR